MSKINWEDFESPYWSPEREKSYDVVLTNWRQEWKSFDEEKTKKPVLSFDVLKIDNEEFPIGKYVFSTGARSFANYAREIIEEAEKRNCKAINIYLEYGKDKKYRVVDLEKVRKKYVGVKGAKP